MRVALVATMVGLTFTSNPALAKDKEPVAPPAAYQKLAACKDLADPAARLACYDREVADFAKATAAGDIVIADRATVRETRRGLFGFTLPRINLFGGGKDEDKEEVKEIESTISSARQFGYGSWRITLPDGAVWEQTDSQRLVMDPRTGQKIRIRKAALGSYMVNVDGQPAIRMRRVQ